MGLLAAARRVFSRKTSRRMMSSDTRTKPYFITTPIFYVNAAPHIGHVYTAVLADAAARFQRLIGGGDAGRPVVFSTGTDEHGLKIQQAAEAAGRTPADHCRLVSDLFRQTLHSCQVRPTDFIRTTEQRHLDAVRDFWERLQRGGYVYKGRYEGWYCTADEAFVSENQTRLVAPSDGSGPPQRVSEESGRPVEWCSETNWLFRLSLFRDRLVDWLADGERVRPAEYRNGLRAALQRDLADLSVSRPSHRLDWGVRVPGDDTQTVYVWLDALVNYWTVARTAAQHQSLDCWPPTVHVLGKDILKFHGVYWPAFLMAAGLELPERLLVHGHWLADQRKMSKSTGNVVEPQRCVDAAGVTGLRYFLLHQGVPSCDNNFSLNRMVLVANSELADGLGNLVSRCAGAALNPRQVRPPLRRADFETAGADGVRLLESLRRTPDQVHRFYADFQFYKGIEAAMALVRAANGLFHALEPWNMKKEGRLEELSSATAVAMETSRIVGLLLQPVVPQFASQLLEKLGVAGEERDWQSTAVRWTETERPLGAATGVLFRRIKWRPSS